ncbi:hypothetical protein MmazTMA_27580 [Methanosarcina mazei]|nr:hypothetical protein MmazTMA_27580 [Methanosarcina mazei]
MEWNYIEYVRNFYKIERIVKSNWDKKEGKNKVSISGNCQTKVLIYHLHSSGRIKCLSEKSRCSKCYACTC